jgi:hypothetical protein
MSKIRPSKFLGQSVDTCALDQYHAAIAQLEQRLAEAKAAEDRINQEEIAANKTRDELLHRKRSFQGIQANRRVVMVRLERVRVQLHNSESDSVDLATEEKNVKEKCGVKAVNLSLLKISCGLIMFFFSFHIMVSIRTLTKKMKEFTKLIDQLLVQDK